MDQEGWPSYHSNVKRRTLAAILCLLFAGLSASADSVEATFVGVNGTAAFGFYISPYFGILNGAPVTFYCVDFANEVQIGESWEANLTLLSGDDLSNTRYGGVPNAQTIYEEAAWLTTQFASNPTDYANIQATIWQLFDPGAPLPSSNDWATLAAQNYQTIDRSLFEIVTNVGPVLSTGQVQEFLIDPAPVPEPSALVLLATALALTCWFFRRRLSAL